MTAGSLFFICSVALGRDVGPENLKKAYLRLSSGVRAAFHPCVDGIEELWNTERPGVNNLMVVVCIALCCGLLQSL
jgi:hypothetical protein